jgi:hypothetical protein
MSLVPSCAFSAKTMDNDDKTMDNDDSADASDVKETTSSSLLLSSSPLYTAVRVCGQATCGLFICGDLLVWDEKDDNISFECWSSINKKSRMPRDPVNTLVKHDNNISAFCVKELEESKDFFFCENPNN